MTELWGTPTSRDLVEVNGLAKVIIWKHSSMVLWKPQEKNKVFLFKEGMVNVSNTGEI